jgi:hypothetical protein
VPEHLSIVPRKNKSHSERRRKTKNYRNKTIRLDKPKSPRYKSLVDNVDEIEEFGLEEYSGKDYDQWENGASRY